MRRYALCQKKSHFIFILLILLLCLNFIILFRLLTSQSADESRRLVRDESNVQTVEGVSDATFILGEFEEFSNDVSYTLGNVSVRFARSQMVVIFSRLPYPPINLTGVVNAQLIVTDPYPGFPVAESRPDHYINSKYVIIIPDSVRPGLGIDLDYMIDFLKDQSALDKSVSVAAWPLTSNISCLGLHADLRSWTLRYSHTLNDLATKDSMKCDAIEGSHFVLLMSTRTLLNFSLPFLRPLHRTLFIQNVLRRGTVAVDLRFGYGNKRWYKAKDTFQLDSHLKWKRKLKEVARLKMAYNALGVKLVQWNTGNSLRNSSQRVSNSVKWYGCSKDSDRCFGTVLNDVPDYIHAGRWTPPCCLRALRETATQVFKTLTSQVRYKGVYFNSRL